MKCTRDKETRSAHGPAAAAATSNDFPAFALPTIPRSHRPAGRTGVGRVAFSVRVPRYHHHRPSTSAVAFVKVDY